MHLKQTPGSSICVKEFLEGKRHSQDPDFIPKWKRDLLNQKATHKCMFPNCKNKNDNVKKASFARVEAIADLAGIASSNNEIYFCSAHYNDMHRKNCPPLPCAFCGAYLKPFCSFTHHSPDADYITQYFNNLDSSTPVQIEPHDYICLACYKLHASIISSTDINSPQPTHLRGSFCGPSCRCLNCSNLYITQPSPEVSSETRYEAESDSSSDESCEEVEQEIVTDMDDGVLINYDIS